MPGSSHRTDGGQEVIGEKTGLSLGAVWVVIGATVFVTAFIVGGFALQGAKQDRTNFLVEELRRECLGVTRFDAWLDSAKDANPSVKFPRLPQVEHGGSMEVEKVLEAEERARNLLGPAPR